MSGKKSNMPRLAIWLLQHAYPRSNNEVLAGDLVERFHEGRSHLWLWKQVLLAIAVSVLTEIRLYWPHVCYAIAGTAISLLVHKPLRGVAVALHWSVMPWPLYMLVFELSTGYLLALAALPAFAAGLMIDRAFRWGRVFRTGLINLALITLGHYLLDACPWLFRPIPGSPYLRTLIIPTTIQIALLFSAFVVSAWLGCRTIRRPTQTLNPQTGLA